MALDASIYGNIQAPQSVQQPSFIDTYQKALSLKQLGLQNQQMQLQMQTQQAMRDAYANNVSPDGKLNQSGFLNDVGRVNPQAAIQMGSQFNKYAKDQADAQTARMQAAHQISSIVQPKMEYLAGLSPDDRAKAYDGVMKQAAQEGVPMQNVPKDSDGNYLYDEGLFKQHLLTGRNVKEALDNQLAQANIAKTQAETPFIRDKNQAELESAKYGSRSPNAELTSQYSEQAKPIRQSQMAMQQMIDNYHHPSPQGDASLILNAFKIKFPNAPDVNSLKELSESQAASDQFKQIASRALQGGLDQNTRDNLMRDGISTYRANVDTLRGIQGKYQTRAKFQGVDDPTITMEPAIDRTNRTAMALGKQLGSYVPPSNREGFIAGVNRLTSNLFGVGGNASGGGKTMKSANAAEQLSGPKQGTVEDGYVFMGGDPSDQKSWKKAR